MERDTAGREIRGSHAVQGARQEGSSLVEQKAAGGGGGQAAIRKERIPKVLGSEQPAWAAPLQCRNLTCWLPQLLLGSCANVSTIYKPGPTAAKASARELSGHQKRKGAHNPGTPMQPTAGLLTSSGTKPRAKGFAFTDSAAE